MNAVSFSAADRSAALRTVTWRLLPFLMLCYFFSYLDRINIGFAALQMRGELNLSATSYGIGGSLFLITYCFFSVPSNAGLQKFGARRWIAILMVIWGCLSMAMALVREPIGFYVLRLLVGAAEAGFFPGMVFYITCWFPANYRARIASIFLLAVPLSSFVGSTVSGALMEIHGAYGLSGWQWLFIIEGLPSVLLGACFVLLMKDGPGDVRWLTPAQKAGLTRELDEEKKRKTAVANLPLLKVMLNKHILALSLTYSGVLSVGVCLSLWQPQLIKSFGLTNFQTGLLSSVPFGVATVVMVLWGRSSDRRIERVWHTVIPLVLSMCAMLATFVFGSLSGTIVLLSLMLAGSYSAKGPFWALVTQSVSAKTVAVGLAVVSGMGSIATALTTYLFGVIREHTGSYQLALLPLVALTLGGSLVLFVVGMQRPDAQAMPALETAEAQ